MKLGIVFGDFSWPVPAGELGGMISRLGRQADEAGVDSLWVMDHFFQIRLTGLPPESPMLESYATLGVLAGQTTRIKLGTLVTSVAYRHPGVLVKTVTTLDVLSGGRMYLGVGAGAPWNVPPQGPGTAWEAEGLGIPFPPLADRFEMLEELLQVANQMWAATSRRMTASTTSSSARSTRPARCSARARRSSSPAAASARRCGSSRATRTPATCSTRQAASSATTSGTSSTSCASTAPRPAGTTTRSRRPSAPGPTSTTTSAKGSARRSSGCASCRPRLRPRHPRAARSVDRGQHRGTRRDAARGARDGRPPAR